MFKSQSKTLGQLNREFDLDFVIGLISVWLIELNDSSSVKNKMSDSQMEFTAHSIYETYSLRIADLVLFFKNVKEGVYGEYYEKLSSEKIMQWMAKYYDERCKMAENYQDLGRDKLNLNTTKIHPKVSEIIFKDVGKEKVDHRIDYKNGLGTRLKNKMEKTQEEFIDRLKKDVKTSSKESLENLIKTWSKRNDMKMYVEILEEELKSR